MRSLAIGWACATHTLTASHLYTAEQAIGKHSAFVTRLSAYLCISFTFSISILLNAVQFFNCMYSDCVDVWLLCTNVYLFGFSIAVCFFLLRSRRCAFHLQFSLWLWVNSSFAHFTWIKFIIGSIRVALDANSACTAIECVRYTRFIHTILPIFPIFF